MESGTNFLVILGPPGTGKTYLCASLLEFAMKRFRDYRAYSERELFRRIRGGISDSSTGDYIKHLHSLIDDQLVILDDIGSSGHTEWRQEVLMEAIDVRYSSKAATIITSNMTKKEFIQIYGKRIASRLFAKENTVIDLSGMVDMREQGK